MCTPAGRLAVTRALSSGRWLAVAVRPSSGPLSAAAAVRTGPGRTLRPRRENRRRRRRGTKTQRGQRYRTFANCVLVRFVIIAPAVRETVLADHGRRIARGRKREVGGQEGGYGSGEHLDTGPTRERVVGERTELAERHSVGLWAGRCRLVERLPTRVRPARRRSCQAVEPASRPARGRHFDSSFTACAPASRDALDNVTP